MLNAIYLVFILFFKQTKVKLFTHLLVVLFQKFHYMYAVILTTFKDSLSKEAELTGICLSPYLDSYCHSYQCLHEPDD